MVVIADASPLNCLVLIQQIEFLPRPFQKLLVPRKGLQELAHAGASVAVASWVAAPPAWVRRVDRTPPADDLRQVLGRGERAARERQIPIIGILGILESSAARGWIDLAAAIADLQSTAFRVAPRPIASLLDRDSRRKTGAKASKENQ
jgi:predicted nucleic acid-binding protein